MQNFQYKKSLGQNFLNDDNIINNIVEMSNIIGNSLVIEVGCGSGVLTKKLAQTSTKVLAYEIDNRLEDILDENLLSYNNVEIIFDDFLKRDISTDIKKYQYDNLYFVANLPYYITTPIMEKLIESKLPFKGITVMVQKEVGERFMANPKTREYGSLTVFLHYYFDITKLFVVDRTCFTPRPNVDSIVLSLKSKEDQVKVKDEDKFFSLIRDAFHFKRKNLHNNLKNYDLVNVNEILNKYGLDMTARAEELSLEIFMDIANNL